MGVFDTIKDYVSGKDKPTDLELLQKDYADPTSDYRIKQAKELLKIPQSANDFAKTHPRYRYDLEVAEDAVKGHPDPRSSRNKADKAYLKEFNEKYPSEEIEGTSGVPPTKYDIHRLNISRPESDNSKQSAKNLMQEYINRYDTSKMNEGQLSSYTTGLLRFEDRVNGYANPRNESFNRHLADVEKFKQRFGSKALEEATLADWAMMKGIE